VNFYLTGPYPKANYIYQQQKQDVSCGREGERARQVGLNSLKKQLYSHIQFNSIQFYLYSAKLQQMSSQGT